MIRPAHHNDIEAIREIVHAAYLPYIARIGKPPGPMLDDYSSRVADGQAWVLQHSGRIAGILILEERPDCFLLDNVAVHPDHQGHGYGRTLIAFAEAEAQRRGWREIVLYTHALMTGNQALYRRIGFVETGRMTEKGFDRVYMSKRLPVGP